MPLEVAAHEAVRAVEARRLAAPRARGERLAGDDESLHPAFRHAVHRSRAALVKLAAEHALEELARLIEGERELIGPHELLA